MIILKDAKIGFSCMTDKNRIADGSVIITGRFDDMEDLIAGVIAQAMTRCEVGEFIESLMIIGGK